TCVCEGENPPEKTIFSEESAGPSRLISAVEWPYKCILNVFTGDTLLFNLDDDPGEKINLVDKSPEIVAKLSDEILTTIVPRRSILIVQIVGNPTEKPKVYEGTVRIPTGVEWIKPINLDENDIYTSVGDKTDFKITSSSDPRKLQKNLLIILAPDVDSIEIELKIDGGIAKDRFFPYGNGTPEQSGIARIRFKELPWPASLPRDTRVLPSACYIIGIPGSDEEAPFSAQDLDEETREQLRALGYMN
ncbi:MAG: hypothetical protein ABIC40_04915, partial [bacterium]